MSAKQERTHLRHRLLRPHLKQQLRIALSAIGEAKARKANPAWKMIDGGTIETDVSESGLQDGKAECRTIKSLYDKSCSSRIGRLCACWIRAGNMSEVMGPPSSALSHQWRTALAS
jgi:hypothetical protein